MSHAVQRLTDSGKAAADIRRLQERFESQADEEIAGRLFMGEPFALTTCPLNPFRLNERLRIQKGVFLVAGTIERSFMENLNAIPGHDDPRNIVQLVIPSKLRMPLLQTLFSMNITRTSLFPGLDGFAQSLGVYHPVFHPDEPLASGFWVGDHSSPSEARPNEN